MLAEYELAREYDERLFVSANTDHENAPHFHRKLELMYVLEGEKKVMYDNVDYTLKQDQILLVDSYIMHNYYKSENSKQILVVIPNHLLKDYYLLYSNKRFKNCIVTNKYEAQMLKPTFAGLASRESNPLLNQGRIDLLIGQLIELLGIKDREVQFDQGLVEEVLAYIQEHYKDEIDLETLANHFNYSKYYFSRLFNGYLHTNITNYLSMVRLQAAIELLRRSDMTVSDAALEAGFSSIQTFYRAGKRNYSYKKIKDLIEREDEIRNN
jgi:AraC-like DNA-binding protein